LKELKQLTNLNLDLFYNSITDEGVQEISTVLKELKQLNDLNLKLWDNIIGDEGAK
jgi:hypothetical protein